jgi:Leucine-rich repeat (LRR) protein
MDLTKTRNLETVRFLELVLDSRKVKPGYLGLSLDNQGKMVPNMEQLKLNNSHISLIRDLGTGYSNLTVLWMAKCNLSDLDGIGSMRNMRELYLAYNDIVDISSLGMLEKLEVLDLEWYPMK